MANMTASTSRQYKGDPKPWKYRLVGYTDYQGGSAAWTAYKGGIAMMDVSDVDGYAQKQISSVAIGAGDVFLGIFMEEVSVAAADAAQGAKTALVARGGIWAFPKQSLSVTDIGAVVYAVDDDGTVSSTSTSHLAIGILIDVDDTCAWVEINDYAGKVGYVN
jgi:predicted RecA/RadA family phage recombinase